MGDTRPAPSQLAAAHAGPNTRSSDSPPLDSELTRELYFLIYRFLESSPCTETRAVLARELEAQGLLPQRHDGLTGAPLGNTSLVQVKSEYRHITADYLFRALQQTSAAVSALSPPPVQGVTSFLSSGRFSLLRSIEKKDPLKLTVVKSKHREPHSLISFMANHRNHAPIVPSCRYTSSYPVNLVSSLIARELAGPKPITHIWPVRCYERYEKYKRILGHLSSVYCVLFDRTGRYIFTGADDRLVKIWSAVDGRLMMTLRGHEEEITDLSVDYDNSMVATGSCDKIIRVWCLKTTAPVAILREHTATVTSVRFCPLMKDPEKRYLVSSSNDGCVCFWEYNPKTRVFKERPIRFIERKRPGSHILCVSFSAGGVFLAVGSSDAYLRVYHVAAPAGPTKILEIEEHSDHVDSMQFSNHSTRFASGSRDGIARIWYYEKQSWKNIALKMSERLPGTVINPDDVNRKLRVSMVGWTCDDAYVITSLNDNSIKIWDSMNGKLKHVLIGHEQEVFVLEAHPHDPRLFLSGGHDGALILWDVITGSPIRTYFNGINGQGHGAIFDAKFSPDGNMFASTDSHGHLTLFGLPCSKTYEKLPDQIFFHTDYRPLTRDANQYVIDEQTQIAPHLMPPAFLVDIEGNPYPPAIQQLVPGRENCTENQLIPYVAPNLDDGQFPLPPQQWQPPLRADQEDRAEGQADGADPAHDAVAAADQQVGVVDPLAPLPVQLVGDAQPAAVAPAEPADPAVHNLIDERIEAMRRAIQPPAPQAGDNLGGARDRRNGDVEGVLQLPNFYARGNVLRPNWHRRPVVPMLSQPEIDSQVDRQKVLATVEEEYYATERRKRAEVPDAAVLKEIAERERLTRSKRRIIQQRRGVRLPPIRPGELENIEEMHISEDDEENDRDFSANDSSSSATTEDESDEEWNGPGTGGGDQDSRAFARGGPLGRIHSTHSGHRMRPAEEGRRARRLRLATRNGRRGAESASEEEEEEDDQEQQPSSGTSRRVSMANVAAEAAERRDRSRRRPGDSRQNRESREERRMRRDHERQRRRREQLEAARTAAVRRREAIQADPPAELPDGFRPPEWLTDSRPRRTPYFPQIGDEVVYFRSGHQQYIDVVRGRQLYKEDRNVKPYKLKFSDSDEIFARVEKIVFDIKPVTGVRVATLRMVVLDPEAEEPITGTHFSIKYHDVENVVDFIVLKKYYDQSIAREWKPSDEFRAVIDDKWWFGLINSQRDADPFTWFQCFAVTWANGDTEYLSPWDLEPIPEGYDRSNARDGEEGLEVTEEEREAIIDNDFVDTDNRLYHGLIRVMEFSQSEDFNVPVDLNVHFYYGMLIAYLMDLSTIKARIENRFYRRLEAIIYDVNAIEANALQYNVEHSEIVNRARIVTTVLRRFIEDPDCYDPTPIYTEIVGNLEDFLEQNEVGGGRSSRRGGTPNGSQHTATPESDRPRRSTRRPRALIMSDSDEGTTNGHGNSSSQARAISRRSQRTIRAPAQYQDESSVDAYESPPAIRPWKQNCRELLDYIFDLQDSEPFRTQVDPIQYPNYSHVIDTPMDLTTVKEQLLADIYDSPADFCKDMRLIFSNSKQFNTNKKSRIYSMTIRLSSLFEEKMRKIMSDFKSATNFLKKGGAKRRPLNSFSVAMAAEMNGTASGSGRNARSNGYGPGPSGASSSRSSRSGTSQSLRSPHSKSSSQGTASSSSNSSSGTAAPKRTLFSDGESTSDSKYGLRQRKKTRTSYEEDDSEASKSTVSSVSNRNGNAKSRAKRSRKPSPPTDEEEESEESEATNTTPTTPERPPRKVQMTSSGRIVKRPALLLESEEEEEEDSDDDTKAEEEEAEDDEVEEEEDEDAEEETRGNDSDATQIDEDEEEEEEGDDTDKENENESNGRSTRRSARDHRVVDRYGHSSQRLDDRRRPTSRRAAAQKRVNYDETITCP